MEEQQLLNKILQPTPQMLAWQRKLEQWIEGGPALSQESIPWKPKGPRLGMVFSSPSFLDHTNCFMFRERFVRQYGFVVPTKELIESLVNIGPIVEVGCGGGLLAYLTNQMGGDIIPTDLNVSFNSYVNHFWTDVEQMEACDALEKYSERTALFTWPEMEDWAGKALLKTLPKQVLYIGEWGGCTGDDVFHETLDKHYQINRQLPLVNWPAIHDQAILFEKL